MPQVNVTINGRQFRMACKDGQEEHLTRLARELDARVESLRGKFGEIGDTRLTVMAALTIADELGEMASRLRRLEDGVGHRPGAGGEHRSPRNRPASAAALLNAAAERIESVTKKLNTTVGANTVSIGGLERDTDLASSDTMLPAGNAQPNSTVDVSRKTSIALAAEATADSSAAVHSSGARNSGEHSCEVGLPGPSTSGWAPPPTRCATHVPWHAPALP